MKLHVAKEYTFVAVITTYTFLIFLSPKWIHINNGNAHTCICHRQYLEDYISPIKR